MGQYKSPSLDHLEQKLDSYQDDNDVDVARELRIFLRSFDTSIYKMSDMEILQVYLILKRLPFLDVKFSTLTINL